MFCSFLHILLLGFLHLYMIFSHAKTIVLTLDEQWSESCCLIPYLAFLLSEATIIYYKHTFLSFSPTAESTSSFISRPSEPKQIGLFILLTSLARNFMFLLRITATYNNI